MKRTVYLALLLLFGGCTQYLTVQPQGEVIPQTDEEFAAIMHTRIREIEGGEDEYIFGNMESVIRLEGCADDLDANISAGRNLPSYAGEVINIRQSSYRYYWEVIRDCNIVIENLQGRDTETARGTLTAAYAMKAFTYYNLLRIYCEAPGQPQEQLGLPLVDHFDITDRPLRATLEQTGAYIGGLFDKALAQGPQDGLWLFTEPVIQAGKARFLFWMEDWEGAAALCRNLIEHSGYRLSTLAEFPDMIGQAYDKKGEVILRSHTNNSSELDWYFSAIKGYVKSRPASARLVALFDNPSADVRYACSLDAKFYGIKVPEMRLRLAEIYLMLAECEAHLGHTDAALNALNELRSHRIAGATPLSAATLPALRSGDRITEDALGRPLTPLMQAIFDERRRELFLEGDRWFELKRNGCPQWWIISNGLKYTTRKYLYTAPIYKGDVDLNPDMKQNEGYED